MPDLTLMRRAAAGRAHSEMFRPLRVGVDELAKALTPDDSYEIPDGDRGVKREPACPECGRIFKSPAGYARHRIATGHGVPKPRVENAEVAGRTDAESGYVAKASKPDQRYTFSILYLASTADAHSEFADADALQKAAWDYFRSGDRKLRRQHGSEVVGEIVEMVSWPSAHVASLTQADGTVHKQKCPAGSVYIGSVWTPEAWPSVLDGSLRGYSMGGRTLRTRGVPLP